MNKIFVLLCIFVSKSNSIENFDAAHLIFVGSNKSDFKIFNLNPNFNEISGTRFFNATKPSVLFLHGWRDSYYNEIGTAIVDAYLKRVDFNIIFAEWSTYAYDINYLNVVNKLSKIAQTYVQLLKQIHSTGYDLTRIHFVGHSLGSHVAGRIGNLLQSENIFLSRITGLDPAGPLFSTPTVIDISGIRITLPVNPCLEKGNANFVDIIHTEAGQGGITYSSGDLDFWVNGGSNQPSCISVTVNNAITDLGCSHRMAWRYYAESVKRSSSSQSFTALKCINGITDYKKKSCIGPEQATMGFYASIYSEPGNYFLETRASSPYSL